MAEQRARKRRELLAASERQLNQISAATQRARNPLRGKARIALRVGGVLGRYKMRKHFRLTIEETGFSCVRDDASIAREAALDGIYLVPTSVPPAALAPTPPAPPSTPLPPPERHFPTP